jgi:hypothetical protein
VRIHVSFPVRGILLVAAMGIPAIAQQAAPTQEKPPAQSPSPAVARLAAAKTAWLKRTGNGGNIAYDVIKSTLDGWGRFTLVDVQDKADLIVEINSVAESDGGVSASAGANSRSGTAQLTTSLIKLAVYDGKTRAPLWAAVERPKGALKKVDRENNEVAAAQRLVTKLHDTLEPAPQ